jgi:hypothetical protein
MLATSAAATVVLLFTSSCGATTSQTVTNGEASAPSATGDPEAPADPRVTPPSTFNAEDSPRIVKGDEPCMQGVKLATPKGISDIPAGAPLLLPPVTGPAGDLTALWHCSGAGWIYTTSEGVNISFESDWASVDGDRHWPAYVAQNKYGTYAKVRSGMGVIEEPDSNHTGQVMVIEGSYLIRVLGNSQLRGTELLGVANSISGRAN